MLQELRVRERTLRCGPPQVAGLSEGQNKWRAGSSKRNACQPCPKPRVTVKGEVPVCVSVCSCKEGMAEQPPRGPGPQAWVKSVCAVGCSNTD